MSETNLSITQNIYNALIGYAAANETSYLGRSLITPDVYTDIAKSGSTVRVGNMEGGRLLPSGDGQTVYRADVFQFVEIYNVPQAQTETERPTAEREVELIADEVATTLWNADFDCINVTEIVQRNTYTKPGSIKTPTAELRILINPSGES